MSATSALTACAGRASGPPSSWGQVFHRAGVEDVDVAIGIAKLPAVLIVGGVRGTARLRWCSGSVGWGAGPAPAARLRVVPVWRYPQRGRRLIGVGRWHLVHDGRLADADQQLRRSRRSSQGADKRDVRTVLHLG